MTASSSPTARVGECFRNWSTAPGTRSDGRCSASTGPGFTVRLSAQLRDRQGLAYTVSATITPGAAELPGAFTCFIGTFPDKFTAAKDGFMKELKAIRAEAPTDQEVEDAKRYLIGS